MKLKTGVWQMLSDSSVLTLGLGDCEVEGSSMTEGVWRQPFCFMWLSSDSSHFYRLSYNGNLRVDTPCWCQVFAFRCKSKIYVLSDILKWLFLIVIILTVIPSYESHFNCTVIATWVVAIKFHKARGLLRRKAVFFYCTSWQSVLLCSHSKLSRWK